MDGLPIDLIIQVLSGAVGGNLIGALIKRISLGWLGNTIAGGGGAAVLTFLAPILQQYGIPVDLLINAGQVMTDNGFDLSALLQHVAGGGVGGGIVMTVIGILKALFVR